MQIDAFGDLADAADQVLRARITHHPRQRRIGVEQFAARRRHIDAVDRGLEQFSIAFLGKPLLGERADRGFPRGVGIVQGLAKHLGGAGDVADFVVDVGCRNLGILLAAGDGADRRRDRRQRTHGAANHQQRCEQADQHAHAAEHDALPPGFHKRAGEVARQHMAAPRRDLAQNFGDALDQPPLGAQHLLVDLADLPLANRDRNDRLGIIVDGLAQLRVGDRDRAHVLCGDFGGGRIMRQQRRGDPVLQLEQARRDDGIRAVDNRSIELFAQRRQADDEIGAAIDQRGNPLDPGAVGGQPLGDAVDHVLLLGRKLEPRLLQDVAERVGRLRDLGRLRAGIGDEIARRKPQFVHAPVDVLGEVADALQPLQFAKGLSDVTDGDHARRTGDDDHRQHEQKAAERQLADRERERPLFW